MTGRAAAAIAFAACAPFANAGNDALIEEHVARAAAAARLGRTEVVLAERRQVVELAADSRNLPKHLLDLAVVEMTVGNWTDAERSARRAATASTAWHGQDVAAYALLARMQSWLGDVRSARTKTEEIEGKFRWAATQSAAQPFIDLVRALLDWAKADTQLADGNAALAEAHLKSAIEHMQADVRIAERRAESVERAPAADCTWLLLDLMEAQLARLRLRRGNAADAELTARSMLTRNLDRFGRDAPATGVALATLGEVFAGQGRWKESEALAQQAIDALSASGAQAASTYSFTAHKVRIDAAIGQGRWKEAEERIDALRRELQGAATLYWATERQDAWAIPFIRGKRGPEAATWLARLHEEQAAVLGAQRYETLETLGLLGAAMAAKGDVRAALDAFSKAVPVLTAPARGAEADVEDAMRALKRREIVHAYIALLHDLQGSEVIKARGLDPAAEALRLSDTLRGGAMQSALAASAARALAGTPKLGELIRREQDGRHETALLQERLVSLSTAPPSGERDRSMNALRVRLDAIDSQRADLFRTIERQFPDYSNLLSPKAAGRDEAMKVLKANEALIAILPSDERTFVWALDASGKLGFHAAALPARELDALVARLREAVDPPRFSFEALAAFDFAAAHQLYALLLAPLEPRWAQASDVTIVATGSIARLPLGILTTAAPSEAFLAATRQSLDRLPFENMKAAPWLERRVSVTNVPSINAFVRLRALPERKSDRFTFAGFADPVFSGYSQLPPLPDTREEVLAIAAALHADTTSDVFLGKSATRRSVLGADLARRRVVAFATHGLVAGDLPGLTQPALALSNDESARASPFLTLEDVLGLKLDADLVVLSACNTAASDGRGEEAMSGLGRGFFYAGSRAILATHWPVDTVAARMLVTALFARYSADANLTRAQALRQASLALMDGPPATNAQGKPEFSFAHPLYWAPYSLYGDGAR